jgi:hypothetical protein
LQVDNVFLCSTGFSIGRLHRFDIIFERCSTRRQRSDEHNGNSKPADFSGQ